MVSSNIHTIFRKFLDVANYALEFLAKLPIKIQSIWPMKWQCPCCWPAGQYCLRQQIGLAVVLRSIGGTLLWITLFN